MVAQELREKPQNLEGLLQGPLQKKVDRHRLTALGEDCFISTRATHSESERKPNFKRLGFFMPEFPANWRNPGRVRPLKKAASRPFYASIPHYCSAFDAVFHAWLKA